MYLKNIGIKNIGPMSELAVELPFHTNGNPKPIIFVGENGTGKTIVQSQIIDAFYEITSSIFDNVSVHSGLHRNFYRVAGRVLKTGTGTGFSILRFVDNSGESIEYFDKVGQVTEKDFVKMIPNFNLMPHNDIKIQKDITSINGNKKDTLEKEWNAGAYFYQPAYRYEEPFWKNETFMHESRIEDQKKYARHLNKEIEVISSNKDNKTFLLDLVLDTFIQTHQYRENSVLWDNTNLLLKKILKNDTYRLGISPRGRSRISVGEDFSSGEGRQRLPSIDNLSLGQSILFNLFINIIRHSDRYPSRSLNNIRGIVVIDEIDVHLHTDLQTDVLPELIKMFPKVQFILTTHSPMFLLGMKKVFGEENFEIRNLPSGEVITTERFSEFEKAYEVLKETEKFEKDIKQKVENSTKPILFVEGDYDVKYINVAAEKLGKIEILEKIQVYNATGCGNLDKVWKSYDSKLAEVIPQKILLMYDCDTNKQDADRDKVFKRMIPRIDSNLIDKGIENLFEGSTLKKALKSKKAFIDITPQFTKTEKGKKVVIPEKWEVNEDEKGNLCNWICENGTKNDFKNFEAIFKIIEDVLLVGEGQQEIK